MIEYFLRKSKKNILIKLVSHYYKSFGTKNYKKVLCIRILNM